MTSRSRRRVAWAAFALGGAVAVATGLSARATASPTPEPSSSQTTTYDKVPDKFSLTVSPTRIVVDQKHNGDQQKILVVNRGQAALAVTTEKRDFTGGTDGTLVFSKDAAYSASSWVTVEPTTFELAPGASRTVTATIRVPAEPEPGDHQVAFVFLVPSVKASGNIKINRGIGVPMYVTVPGAVDRSVSLTKLTGPRFSAGGTVTMNATLHNTGTVHRDFRGTTPLMQKEGGTSTQFADFTVIRGATREVSSTWEPPLMCICHVSVAIANPDGTPQLKTVRVIVFPVKIAGGMLAGLVALVALIVWRRRHGRLIRLHAMRAHPVPVPGD